MEDDWEFFIDSLTAAGYNSVDNDAYAEKPVSLYAPNNSINSIEEIDFQSSSEEEKQREMEQFEKERQQKKDKKGKRVNLNK